jgi:hypothetical protein
MFEIIIIGFACLSLAAFVSTHDNDTREENPKPTQQEERTE